MRSNLLNFRDFMSSNPELFQSLVLLLQLITIISLFFIEIDNFSPSFKIPTISSESELKSSICYFAFKNLTAGDANENLFEKETADALNEVSEAFPTKVTKIFDPQMLDTSKCKLTMEDEEGLRVFELSISEGKGAFGYLVSGIIEKQLEEEEL